MATWAFTDDFDPVRREKLQAVQTFDRVIELIRSNSQIEKARMCEAKKLGIKCRRPAVALKVGSEVFDAFYNSPRGYRAQYLASPEEGQAANGRLLRVLEPKLTEEIIKHFEDDRLHQNSVRLAFLANSAKIWPDEEHLDFLQATIDLDIQPWRERGGTTIPRYAGLWAPTGTILAVFGAFIDSNGNEVVSPEKILRRFEIHDCGFS